MDTYHPEWRELSFHERTAKWNVLKKTMKPLGKHAISAVRQPVGFARFSKTATPGPTGRCGLGKRAKRQLRQHCALYQQRCFVAHDAEPDKYDAPWLLPQELSFENTADKGLPQVQQFGFVCPVDTAVERQPGQSSSSSSSSRLHSVPRRGFVSGLTLTKAKPKFVSGLKLKSKDEVQKQAFAKQYQTGQSKGVVSGLVKKKTKKRSYHW